MALITFQDDVRAAFDDWIHTEYGKKAGLKRHEYSVQIDTDCTDDVRIAAGATIMIVIPLTPGHPNFNKLLRHVFRDYPLQEFLRTKALVRASDAVKWYSVSESGFANKLPKKPAYDAYSVRFVTRLVMQDKKTKKKVEVEIEGAAFQAQQIALQMLYGSEPASQSTRWMNARNK